MDLSGGRIDIRSDQHSGTEVKLSLPLENCLPVANSVAAGEDQLPDHEDPVDAVRRRAVGRTFNIHGFNSPCGRSDVQAEALASLRESMEKYATQWFHLVRVSSGEDADVSISDEASFLNSSSAKSKSKILLVLCHNSARRELYPTTTNSNQIIEFVSRPCGPHRLAKALLNCLDTEDSAPPTIPKERVSAQGSHSGGAPPDSATLTAGTSNARLIGDLQSSIGFSPAVISLIKTPGLQTKTDANLIRPPITHRMSNASTGSAKSRRSTFSYSDKVVVVSAEDIFPSSPTSPISSDDIIFEQKTPDATPSPPRQPKMLLVEVGEIDQIFIFALTGTSQDNPVNMMLLATYMKKNKWEYEKATNGLLALQAFRESPVGFDVIFMGMSIRDRALARPLSRLAVNKKAQF